MQDLFKKKALSLLCCLLRLLFFKLDQVFKEAPKEKLNPIDH